MDHPIDQQHVNVASTGQKKSTKSEWVDANDSDLDLARALSTVAEEITETVAGRVRFVICALTVAIVLQVGSVHWCFQSDQQQAVKH